MTILKTLTGRDNPILRAKSKPVSRVTREINTLIEDMKQTMARKHGVGLAAPQIGQNIRVVLIALQKSKTIGEDFRVVPMINPEIMNFSSETWIVEEGCLSLPGLFVPVERSRKVTVRYLDEKGHEKIIALENINARIIQHEVDHLDGILIVDRVKKLEKVSDEEGMAI